MSTDRYTTTRVPSARAIGAPSVMAGEYRGTELRRTSTRPGAYDAFALKSRTGFRDAAPFSTPTKPADAPQE